MILAPTGKDLQNPDIAACLEQYPAGKDLPARARIQLFKLAWDMLGERFGSRQLQYEWFYAGDPNFTRARFYTLAGGQAAQGNGRPPVGQDRRLSGPLATARLRQSP